VTTFCTKVKSSDPDSAEANLSGATALEGVPMLVLGGGMSRYAARCWQRWGLGNIIFSGLRWRPGGANWRFLRERDAVECASGTDALCLALAAAGVVAGDQVLTSQGLRP
jgi:hypothetical protein